MTPGFSHASDVGPLRVGDQACGVTAAVAALSGVSPHAVDPRKVQQVLVEQHANLDLEGARSATASAVSV